MKLMKLNTLTKLRLQRLVCNHDNSHIFSITITFFLPFFFYFFLLFVKILLLANSVSKMLVELTIGYVLA